SETECTSSSRYFLVSLSASRCSDCRSGDLVMMKSPNGLVLLTLALLYCFCGSPARSAAVRPAPQTVSNAEFFKTKILPILTARCQSCHNQTLKLSGLSLESAAAMEEGGVHGPVIVPRNPEQSRLYRRVARMEKPFMPMDGDAVPEAEVALLKT